MIEQKNQTSLSLKAHNHKNEANSNCDSPLELDIQNLNGLLQIDTHRLQREIQNSQVVLRKQDFQNEINNYSSSSQSFYNSHPQVLPYQNNNSITVENNSKEPIIVVLPAIQNYQMSNSIIEAKKDLPISKPLMPNPKRKQQDIMGKFQFKVSFNIKKFVSKIKQKSRSQLFKQITEKQLHILGDLSCNYHFYLSSIVIFIYIFLSIYFLQKNSSLLGLYQLSQEAKSNFLSVLALNFLFSFCLIDRFGNFMNSESNVFLPNSFFLILWRVISFMILVCLILIVPVNFCFGIPLISKDHLLIFTGTGFQGIYKRGILITNKRQIVLNYISRTEFWIDILVLFGFLLSLEKNTEFSQLAIILKLSQIMDFYDSIQNLMDINQNRKDFATFLKIVFQILMVAHLAGCFFIKIALNNKEQMNWITAQDIKFDDRVNIYVTSIYWSVITMITVGYGDITPKNEREKIYVIFVSIISCGIFGYCLNIIGQIVRQREEDSLMFQDKINDLSSFMKKRQVSRDMREKIFKYFHFIHKEELKKDDQITTMTNALPDNLKMSFQIELYQKIIKSQMFFSQTFSESFINQICLQVKEKRIGPEMNLLDIDKDRTKDNYLQERLYFILNGKVAQQISSKEKNLKIFERGDCIGIEEFITGCQEKGICSVYKSVSNVSFAYIEKTDLLNLLDLYPLEKEKFYMAKDKVSFGNEFEKLKQKCFSCESKYHNFNECNFMHLEINKHKLLFNHNISKFQDRIHNFKRFKQKKQTSALLQFLEEDIIDHAEQTEEQQEESNILLQQQSQQQQSWQQQSLSLMQESSTNIKSAQQLFKRSSILQKIGRATLILKNGQGSESSIIHRGSKLKPPEEIKENLESQQSLSLFESPSIINNNSTVQNPYTIADTSLISNENHNQFFQQKKAALGCHRLPAKELNLVSKKQKYFQETDEQQTNLQQDNKPIDLSILGGQDMITLSQQDYGEGQNTSVSNPMTYEALISVPPIQHSDKKLNDIVTSMTRHSNQIFSSLQNKKPIKKQTDKGSNFINNMKQTSFSNLLKQQSPSFQEINDQRKKSLNQEQIRLNHKEETFIEGDYEGGDKGLDQMLMNSLIKLKESKAFDIDRLKNYTFYFPLFNSKYIIKKIVPKQPQVIISTSKHNQKRRKTKVVQSKDSSKFKQK